MTPKPPRSLLLLLLMSGRSRSPSTLLASKAVTDRSTTSFQKFLDPLLLSNCKRNKSSLSSSTLRSSHSYCERREHFSFFNPGFRSSTWSASPMWRSTLTLLLFRFCWCIFQRIQSRSLLRIYNTKQLNRQAKGSILRYTYAFVISKKHVKSLECSKVDIMTNLHRLLKVAGNLHHS